MAEPHANADRLLLTVADAARVLAVSERTVWRLRSASRREVLIL